MGKYETALAQCITAYSLTTDSEWVITHNNLTSVYRLVGDPSNALSHPQIALEIRKKVLQANHSSVDVSFNNVESLEIYRKSLSTVHPRPAETYNNIVFVYDLMSDYSNAVSYYQKALKIQKKAVYH
ncbi:unnamed protein product [Rotaria sp. Silwood2]|nr:unnamed protein product [Rotaria sp. Silwood2]CAF4607420.1 unnamed protein product [Rotaria sp. Silwood2]